MLKHFFFETMTGTVLRYALIGTALLLIALWLWGGGFERIKSFVSTIDSPIDIFMGLGGSYIINLPGQVPIPQGPDISGLVGSYEERSASEDELYEMEQRYKSIRSSAGDIETFGDSSPYRGMITLSSGAVHSGDPSTEYLTIRFSGGNASAISLSGWSLMSLISRTRINLPLAASPYVLGTLSSVSSPTLARGQNAIIVSGLSPVGVSFRENACSGYLSELQSFTPSLDTSCPLPSDTLTLSAGSLQRYGSECIDYVAGLSECRIPETIPLSLSPACRIFIANTFTYNGCIDAHRYDVGFHGNTWRLYLGSSVELWRNSHDVIRLLDSEGRTVDALVY